MFIVNENHTKCVRLTSFTTREGYTSEDIDEAKRIYKEVNYVSMNDKEKAEKAYNEYLAGKEPMVYLNINGTLLTDFACIPKSKADKVIERLLYAIRIQYNLFDLREEIKNA